jgi:enoyl-CoA hydratase/carnithine racemase
VTQPNTIALETRGAIEILTLNRPDQLNAVTPDMIGELTDYFSALRARAS